MDNETEYVRRLQMVDDRSQRNEGRIKKLEADQKALLELTSSVRELANEQGHVKQDLAEIKEDVKGLAARPGKRWDSIVSTLLAALVGAFAALAASSAAFCASWASLAPCWAAAASLPAWSSQPCCTSPGSPQAQREGATSVRQVWDLASVSPT